MSTEQRPPDGLSPRWLFIDKRFEEVRGAIVRYLDAGLSVDLRWIEEYNSLLREIKNRK